MKVQPVRVCAEPEYPVRSAIDERPELLMLVPRRWSGSSPVLAALAGLSVLLPKCGGAAGPATPVSRVAPVFQHGDGHCVPGTMSSPVFLPEDEARQVIAEEAKRAGLEFRPDSQVLPKVEMASKDRSGRMHRLVLRYSLVLDGIDRKHRISYEYVSRDDLTKWSSKPTVGEFYPPWSSQTRSAAETLRAGLEKAKPTGTYAVFYDPVAGQQGFGPDPEVMKKQADEIKAKSTELLREQVRDFIKWLKAEGII